MLSSDEIRNYELKKGIGYSKRSVDQFLTEIVNAYEALFKENIELRDKATALSDGLQYYKSMEKTLQKALVLAQKTSDEEQAKAAKNARVIEQNAHDKADEVLTKARSELDNIFRQTDDLNRRFELYKTHVRNLITSQLDIINSDAYNISVNDLKGYLKLKGNLENVQEDVHEDAKEDIQEHEDKENMAVNETESRGQDAAVQPAEEVVDEQNT
ncbi:MAG: DivIVA domain-containing protein [Peptoanaerobacter stomatis]|uniref:DivIVA domain-containing protein n=1 Tax=Peptoanaerobacter stomatis TaxID=796937 RepID=UPI003FA1170F